MKFNETKDDVEDRTRKENYEGGEAFEPDTPEMGLYKVVVNNLLENKYYTDDEESLNKVKQRFDECAESSPEFVLKLANYARNEMYLRDISQLLLALSSLDDRTKCYTKDYARDIISRADEPATLVALMNELNGGSLPKPLKKGIESSLHQFDEYHFSKYKQSRRDVSLVDVFNLVHPKPENEDEEEIFRSIVLGDKDDYPEVDPLEPPETWEVIISEKGNTEEAWREVLPKLPLFAKIRNLRNMRSHGIPGEEILEDESMDHIRSSMIYPFRFYQAYEALSKEGLLDDYAEDWLSKAIDESSENIPDDLGNSLVSVDLSGSMRTPLSSMSEVEYYEIGSLFGGVLSNKGAKTSAFASGFKTFRFHKDTPTLERARRIRDEDIGMATNGWKAIEWARVNEKEFDRFILVTDMQIWDSTFMTKRSVREEFSSYREEVENDTMLYMIDLSSYGDLVTPERAENVRNISGWNEKVIDYIESVENPGEIIDEIEGEWGL